MNRGARALVLLVVFACASGEPPAQSRDASAAVAQAYHAYLRGEIDRAERILAGVDSPSGSRADRIRVQIQKAALRALILERQRRYEESVVEYEQLLRIYTRSFELIAWPSKRLAVVLVELGRPSEARERLERGLALLEDTKQFPRAGADPDWDARYRLARASLLRGLGRLDDAAALLSGILGEYESRATGAQAAMFTRAALLLGAVRIEQGRPRAAVPAFERALEEWDRYDDVMPDWVPTDELSRASVYGALACARRLSGDREGARSAEAQMSALHAEARERGVGPAAPFFDPPRIGGCSTPGPGSRARAGSGD